MSFDERKAQSNATVEKRLMHGRHDPEFVGAAEPVGGELDQISHSAMMLYEEIEARTRRIEHVTEQLTDKADRLLGVIPPSATRAVGEANCPDEPHALIDLIKVRLNDAGTALHNMDNRLESLESIVSRFEEL